MSKWGVNPNPRKVEAQQREQAKKEIATQKASQAKEEKEWQITDKAELQAIERRKREEEKKAQEAQRKLENKKLYEEDMAKYQSNKGQSNKLTKAEIEKNKQAILLRALAKSQGIDQNSSSSEEEKDEDGEEKFDVAPNMNHINREQEEEDEKIFAEVISASGVDDALQKLGGQADAHPERRMKAAWNKYVEDNLPLMKKENPSLKRSQLLQILSKEWKSAPENPFNQNTIDYNMKK